MRKIILAEGEYYHIYNRGVDRRVTFSEDRDFERFLTSVFLSNSKNYFGISKSAREEWSFDKAVLSERGEPIVSIGAYCLMPNHFHLLLKESVPGGISKFMQRLQAGYTLFFNRKYKRTGALFEGTFKAEHVDTDVYLKYLYTYIHLNPIGIIDKGWKTKRIEDKEKAKDFLKNYKYSSFLDYLGQERLFGKILRKNVFPEYFEKPKDFSSMLEEWLNFSTFPRP